MITTLLFFIIYLTPTMYNTNFVAFFSVIFMLNSQKSLHILCLDSFKHYFELLHSIKILIPNGNYVIYEFCWIAGQQAHLQVDLQAKSVFLMYWKLSPLYEWACNYCNCVLYVCEDRLHCTHVIYMYTFISYILKPQC